MSKINSHYLKLQGSYLFAHINKKVQSYMEKNPDADIIRLGIGDVTLPLPPAVLTALHRAIDEMGDVDSFRGYGPEQGYEFLRKAIVEKEYAPLGVSLELDEVFVSDGSKCDVGNIQEIFSQETRVALGDPVYPVYLDSNIMAGRSGEHRSDGRFEGITYLPYTKENNFSPDLPESPVDLIYLCSPNNPTGTILTREDLTKWVEYARENNAIILFDSAYSAFIQDPDVPRSIYEIPGAKEVAIESKSFSKTAGFTGLRCAFMVIPKELRAYDEAGEKHSLNFLWNRRQCTKFNGVPYIVQRAAEAVYSEQGQQEIAEMIAYYRENARVIREGLDSYGFEVYGGINAPYIWWRLPEGVDSWDFLDKMLNECQVVGTPGVGFGPCGQGYFRLTAFGDKERTREAVERMKRLGFV